MTLLMTLNSPSQARSYLTLQHALMLHFQIHSHLVKGWIQAIRLHAVDKEDLPVPPYSLLMERKGSAPLVRQIKGAQYSNAQGN